MAMRPEVVWFGHLCVERGLLSREHCRALREQLGEGTFLVPLARAAIDKGFATDAQGLKQAAGDAWEQLEHGSPPDDPFGGASAEPDDAEPADKPAGAAAGQPQDEDREDTQPSQRVARPKPVASIPKPVTPPSIPRPGAPAPVPAPAEAPAKPRLKLPGKAPKVTTKPDAAVAKPEVVEAGDAAVLEPEPEPEVAARDAVGICERLSAIPAWGALADMGDPKLRQALVGLFRDVHGEGGGTVHLGAAARPFVRACAGIEWLGDEVLSASAAERIADVLLGERETARFAASGDLACTVDAVGGGRIRVGLSRNARGVSGSYRFIPAKPPGTEACGLPESVCEIGALRDGLVLLGGAPGVGKSTTLAALVDHINQTQEKHIITVESPVEFLLRSGRSVIEQREVGEHTRGLVEALHGALRARPDIVVISDLRGAEPVRLAIEAALSGMLVLGVVTADGIVPVLERVLHSQPATEQDRAARQLAGCLRLVVAQSSGRRAGSSAAPDYVVVSAESGELAEALLADDLERLRN